MDRRLEAPHIQQPIEDQPKIPAQKSKVIALRQVTDWVVKPVAMHARNYQMKPLFLNWADDVDHGLYMPEHARTRKMASLLTSQTGTIKLPLWASSGELGINALSPYQAEMMAKAIRRATDHGLWPSAAEIIPSYETFSYALDDMTLTHEIHYLSHFGRTHALHAQAKPKYSMPVWMDHLFFLLAIDRNGLDAHHGAAKTYVLTYQAAAILGDGLDYQTKTLPAIPTDRVLAYMSDALQFMHSYQAAHQPLPFEPSVSYAYVEAYGPTLWDDVHHGELQITTHAKAQTQAREKHASLTQSNHMMAMLFLQTDAYIDHPDFVTWAAKLYGPCRKEGFWFEKK
jgi:hypothetical protein